MKRFLLLAALVFVGVIAWRVGGRMTPDAVGVAVGVVFGVLASVLAALLVLAAVRRDEQREHREENGRGARGAGRLRAATGNYPPVVVVAPAGYPAPAAHVGQGAPGWQPSGHMALPPDGYPVPEPPRRRYHIIGEDDEWGEDWNA